MFSIIGIFVVVDEVFGVWRYFFLDGLDVNLGRDVNVLLVLKD